MTTKMVDLTKYLGTSDNHLAYFLRECAYFCKESFWEDEDENEVVKYTFEDGTISIHPEDKTLIVVDGKPKIVPFLLNSLKKNPYKPDDAFLRLTVTRASTLNEYKTALEKHGLKRNDPNEAYVYDLLFPRILFHYAVADKTKTLSREDIRHISFSPVTLDEGILLSQKLTLDGEEIGVFCQSRNLIVLAYAPQINLQREGLITNFFDKLFSENEICFLPEEEVVKKRMVSDFLKYAKQHVDNLEANICYGIEKLRSLEDDIFTASAELESNKRFLVGAKEILNNTETLLFEAIEKVKKIPFVTKVELTHDGIKITFKHTTLVIPYEKEEYDIYSGNITFTIYPSGIKVSNDVLISSEYPHPHASGNRPCFGTTANEFSELAASCRFEELAYRLWMWINTYRRDNAYMSANNIISSRLLSGIPVYNSKGVLVEPADDPFNLRIGDKDTFNLNREKYSWFKPRNKEAEK